MTKICAAYIRVSTHDQEEYSPDSQIKLIRSYAKKNDMIVPEEFIFRDDGISGRTAEKRPGFMRMIAMAKQKPRPFECILVWKFSRFARNQEESIVYKSLLKKENDIDVISISEPLMEGPFGDLIERIIEWFDAFYSANLGTEVRRGMTERASRGLPVSAAPLGYKYQNKELVILPEDAEIVRMIYRDFLAGSSIIGIAKKLNSMGIKTKRGKTWANRTVRYILTNPAYTGKLRWSPNGPNDYHNNDLREGTLLVEGEHDPIISQEDFDAAQKRVEETLQRYKGNNATTQRQNVTHMLQGLVRCSACGSTLTNTGPGMNCSGYVHGKCAKSHFIKREKLEELVLFAIETQLKTLDIRLVPRQPQALAGERQHIERKIKQEKSIMQRHLEAYEAGIDSLEEYRDYKSDSESRLQELEGRLAEIMAQNQTIHPNLEVFAQENTKIMKSLRSNDLSPNEKNSLLRGFVDHIIFYKAENKVEVYYYI